MYLNLLANRLTAQAKAKVKKKKKNLLQPTKIPKCHVCVRKTALCRQRRTDVVDKSDETK